MVTVVQLHPQNSAAALGPLAEGLAAAEQALLGRALEFAEPMYAGQVLSTGEPTWSHALGLAASLASIGLDAPGRAAGILFAAPKHLGGVDALRERFGEEIAGLAAGVEKLYQLRVATRGNPHELEEAGVKAEITGRPKHIYSIWNKMRSKSLDFSEVYDVRAALIIVPSVKDCYTALGVVHNLWQPIPKEFDDYISRPKGNLYQSLHTAVVGPAGRTLEVQIRTEEMHRQAEFGVAAHWRYKEPGKPSRREGAFEQKIAWLRELLAWRDEIADWGKSARTIDDSVYVLTPLGKVIDLPAGSTPLDFAYALHTDLGHRCRGARVDGHIVTLDTPLASGQRVEIVAAKSGGPSRDWLSAERGFVKSPRARQKIRQWFNARAMADTIAAGRAVVGKELRREGATQASLEGLASRLGFGKADDLFASVARDEINLRQLQTALRGEPAPSKEEIVKRTKGKTSQAGVLIVGLDRLLTQLARCCKPVPPDPIRGFVTRGKGVSVHRDDCPSLKRLAERQPERLIETDWGKGEGSYTVDMTVTAADRRGLLRDIGDALARERINVTAVRTQSRDELAFMRFTFDVANLGQLKRAFAVVRSLKGVIRVGRGSCRGRPWRRSDTAWGPACWCSSRSPSCSTCIPIRFVPAQPGSGWAWAPASARSSAPRR